MTAAAAPLGLAEAHVRGLALAKEHTERFVRYIGDLGPEDVGAGVPGLTWTVGQTVTHVWSVYLRYTTELERSPTPAAVAAQNAADIARLGVDLPAAAAGISAQMDLLEQVTPHIEPERTFPFHAGQQATLAAGWGNLVGELLAHGDDIARATGKPFGVPSADLEITFRFTGPLLQGWLRPEAAAHRDRWLLDFPFGPITVRFDRGRLEWSATDPGAAPDHVVTIPDAADWALQFPYRRRPPADEATARLAERFVEV